MTRRAGDVDLVVLGPAADLAWSAGRVITAGQAPGDLATALGDALDDPPEAVLTWDPRLGPPPAACVDLLRGPDDVWHAGLALGAGGLPRSIDLVAPTWMLNADPAPDIAATSWRVLPAACLVRTGVLEHLGTIDGGFDSMAAAGLEAGHRWITQGALCRHQPDLVAGAAPLPPPEPLSWADELRFVERRYGRRWASYVALRRGPRRRGLRLARSLAVEPRPQVSGLPRPTPELSDAPPPSVTVVIPTVDRYPWLATVLAQLAVQTVAPAEVIVVDQTARERRQTDVLDDVPGLPARVLVSDRVGQCTARNLALAEASGDALLFVDDDDELPRDLLAHLLARLEAVGADACSGVAVEPGEVTVDPSFRHFRQSDVFPTNNTLLRREALATSGLFDLAFDHGERADHDLGMRLYLGGRRLVLDPDAEVLHHHAPTGGLRAHAARVNTYRASRHSTLARQALAPTEVYLWRRYYNADQVHEAVRLRLLGTFSRRGTRSLKALRVIVQAVLLPDTLRRFRRAHRGADALARDHPTIPELRPAPG